VIPLADEFENDREMSAKLAPSEDSAGDSPPKVRGDSSLLTHVTRRAMATEFAIFLPSQWSHAVELAFETLQQLDEIEQALTIYRDDSEISRVNRTATQQPVVLSAPTFALLERAIRWSERTAGAFDVTAGPLVEAWGFTRRSGRKPDAAEIEVALQQVGYAALVLDAEARTVRFQKPGMSINLGAIGKGDALDRLAASLRANGVTDFLIHGGHSSVIAAGDQQPGSGQGWAVGIAHPTKPKRRLGGIWLKDTSLATSGSGKQFFHHRGQRFGHVIDPRTGTPAGDLLALTVLMDSAADADACATGLFVLGSEHIQGLCEQPSDWLPSMILVRPGNRQDAVVVDAVGEIDWVEETELRNNHV
jgi:FAD:protein FMN transferase